MQEAAVLHRPTATPEQMKQQSAHLARAARLSPRPPAPAVNVSDEAIRAAQALLADQSRMPIVELVQRTVAARFGVSRRDILGPDRRAAVVKARQISMYVAYRVSGYGTPTLGRYFRRDHATIINGRDKIKAAIKDDARLADIVTSLEAKILSTRGEEA